MDDRTFDKIASDTLHQLERRLGDIDDLDADLAGDVLTIELDNGGICVVNSHRAAKQIWFSANRRAWHFDPDEATGRWVEAKAKGELFSTVAEQLSAALGRSVRL